MRFLRSALGLGFALAVCGLAFGQQASERKIFAIEEQPLSSALIAFARQAHVQILRRDEDVPTTGMRAPAVKGELSVEEALSKLLENSGLRYEFVNEGAVRIIKAETRAGVGEERPIRVAQAGVQEAEGSKRQEGEQRQPGEKEEGVQLEEIVVTGTHIRGSAPVASPLTVLDRARIDQSGAATTEQFMRTLPQNFSLVDASTSNTNVAGVSGVQQANNNVSRGAAVNLNGLGAGSTLVLINGHRPAPAGLEGAFADISLVPLSAVERVEVLTDGASAIYGADAVAGVVNFILRDRYEGAQTSLRYGDSTRDGGRELTAAQLLGTSWSGGNVLVSYEHYEQRRVDASQRSFIPMQPADFSIIPRQRRDSGFLSVRQELNDHSELFLQGLLSRREFSSDAANAFSTVHTSGHARQLGAIGGVSFSLGSSWRGEITAALFDGREPIAALTQFGPLFSLATGQTLQNKSTGAAAKADGPLGTFSGRTIRASFGLDYRHDRFANRVAPNDFNLTGLTIAGKRDVSSAYGELLVPLIAAPLAFAHRLELSAAARFDHYSDFGSESVPKIGLMWAPLQPLSLRASYGRAYRAPPLADLTSANPLYELDPIPDPTAPSGVRNTLFYADTGNPALKAERAKTLTLGFDWRPATLPGTSVSASYFRIRYKDRIASPPIVGTIFDIYSQTDTLGRFIDLSPDPQEIAEIFATYPVFDTTFPPAGAAGVQATFDQRVTNIARTRAAGIELNAAYRYDFATTQLTVFVAGNHLLENDYQPIAGATSAKLLDTTFNPVATRLRGGINVMCGGVSSTLTGNYTSSYENVLVTPSEGISSWTTLDWQLAYRTGDEFIPWLRNIDLTLDVQNLANRAPPFIGTNSLFFVDLGYDPSNASPVGRFVSFGIQKRW